MWKFIDSMNSNVYNKPVVIVLNLAKKKLQMEDYE